MSPMPSYEQIIAYLKNMRRRAIAFVWASQLGAILALLSISFVILTAIVALAIPPTAVRVVLLSGLGVVVAGLILWAIAKSTVWAPRSSSLRGRPSTRG